MKILVAAFITALLVFTLATAWMEVVQPRLDVLAQAATRKSDESTPKSATSSNARRKPKLEEDRKNEESDLAAADASTERDLKSTAKNGSSTNVAKEKLRDQLANVQQHELKLAEREKTLLMLYEEIRWEMAAVEELRQQSAREIATAEQRFFDRSGDRPKIASLGATTMTMPVSSQSSSSNGESPSARFAVVLQKLANDGNVTTAASLLKGIKAREAAKVLASLSTRDPALASRLSLAMQDGKDQPFWR